MEHNGLHMHIKEVVMPVLGGLLITGIMFKSHRRHCIIETSNPNGFGAFFL